MGQLLGKWSKGQLHHLVFESTNGRERDAAAGLIGAHVQADGLSVTFPAEPVRVGELERMLGANLVVDPVLAVELSNHRQSAQRSLALGTLANTDITAKYLPWDARLYPYQRVGALWLQYVKRGLLCDEVGLGKTIQALSATRLAGAQRVLIVTLNSVKRSVWEYHCREWLGQDVAVADGTHAQRQEVLDTVPDWLIVNHEMLRLSAGYRNLLSRKWDVVIVDEAHKFQGRANHSQQSKGAELLRTEHLYLLTATPIWSEPTSLWHMLRLVRPNRFRSYWDFINEYFDTRDTHFTREIVGVKADKLDQLQALVAPVLLRRHKDDPAIALALPDKVRETITYDLTPTQRKQYTELKRKLRLETEDGTKHYLSTGAALADMRRLLNAPALVGIRGVSPKDELIDDLLSTIPGKAVIFTWHVDYAQYLANRLETSHGAVVITSATAKPQTVINTFKYAPDCRVLVGTIGAIGTALNDLLVANVAIFAEGSHVPTHNMQAEGRLHRIGAKTDVTIYRLQARNTVEQDVWTVSDTRAELSDELLSFEELIQRVLGGAA